MPLHQLPSHVIENDLDKFFVLLGHGGDADPASIQQVHQVFAVFVKVLQGASMVGGRNRVRMITMWLAVK